MKKPKTQKKQTLAKTDSAVASFRHFLRVLDYIDWANYRPLLIKKPTTKWAFDTFCLLFLTNEDEAIKNLKHQRELFDKLVIKRDYNLPNDKNL